MKRRQLDYCDDVAQGFGLAMLFGGHVWKFDWGEANAFETDWRDAKFGGDDANIEGGADSVDFAFLSTHGVLAGNFFEASFASQQSNCKWVNVPGALGNNKLQFAVFDACQSLQLPNPHLEWQDCFDGLHLIFGFHDLSSDSSFTSSRGHDFGVAILNGERFYEAWLDASIFIMVW